MSYMTLITTVGQAKLAAALLPAGAPVLITHMAIGDGGGAPINPVGLDDLVNEVYRTTLNQSYLNAAGKPVYQMLVAADIGSFVVREISAIDADGDVIFIGGHPAIEKPVVADGAAGELVLQMVVAVADTAAITLVVPSTAIATQAWVDANYNPGALFPGGTTGQVLRKVSNTDGDTEWADPTDVNITVDIVEEEVELTAGQSIIDFTTVTTTGTAFYYEGRRLRPTQYGINTAARITLDSAIATGVLAGEFLHAVQNEPAGQYQGVPIGGIAILAISEDPAVVFGYGTWERTSQGRALYGLKVSDVDFDTIGKTGGAKAHAHTGSTDAGGSHNHGGVTGGHTLTVAELPSHRHLVIHNDNPPAGVYGGIGGADRPLSILRGYKSTDPRWPAFPAAEDDGIIPQNANGVEANAGRSSATGSGTSHDHGISVSGSHSHGLATADANHLPEYEVFAVWKRTA